MDPAQILTAVASRPMLGEVANGDAAVIAWHCDVCRLVVIDGLGHGPQAAEAAEQAVRTCAALPSLGPADLLEACHRGLHGSRGAAITFAWIDAAAARLTLAGVGNVEARLRQAGREQRFSPDRGIAGVALPRIRPVEMGLEDEWLFMIHTDGVQARLRLPDTPQLFSTPPQRLADDLLCEWARPTDDATIAIASCSPKARAMFSPV